MSRHYPRWGGEKKRYRQPVTNLQCDACSGNRIGYVDIQFGWMRGTDDERYFCCERHFIMAQRETDKFLIECENKMAAAEKIIESSRTSTNSQSAKPCDCPLCTE